MGRIFHCSCTQWMYISTLHRACTYCWHRPSGGRPPYSSVYQGRPVPTVCTLWPIRLKYTTGSGTFFKIWRTASLGVLGSTSFLGLDRIRCALHARHNMLCNTTYSGFRPVSVISVATWGVITRAVSFSLFLNLNCTHWEPLCDRKLPLKHTATFSSSTSLVPL